MDRCTALRSLSPLRVLWTEGGAPTTRIRISECNGYEPRDPYRLIGETADRKRTGVRIDVMIDKHDRTYLPTGYVGCHPAGGSELPAIGWEDS